MAAMGAAAARVQEMVDENRIVILESDVKHVFTDIGEIKGTVKALDSKVQALDGKVQVLDDKVQVLDGKVQVLDTKVQELDGKVKVLDRKVDDLDEKVAGVIVALHAFKTEVAKEFAALRDLMRIQIGEVRAEIGGLRTEMIERFGNLKIWVLITVAGSVASLISMAMSIATFIHGWKSP
jgi:chromosome segregation ATPase